ncbi:peptidyl-prolyl cis-trans isomerase FKBP62-like [Miscanthus floridulus]|uniref:peptidyl-prolyl cis-trans isomerase FKBP62-like n=1 Tax=Miscanthus floridulus TaxID=154761 RepID=UPI003457975D
MSWWQKNYGDRNFASLVLDAFGEQGRAAKNQFSAVPPNSAVSMDVELVSLKPVVDVTGDLKISVSIILAYLTSSFYGISLAEQEKESWEMSAHEKLEAAEKSKVAGNDLFKIGKFQRAANKYNKRGYVNEDGHFEDEPEKLIKTLRVSCWLNHAACCLKLKDFTQATSLCSKVLEIESCNVKALYRRAQAYGELYDLELARQMEVKLLQANLKKLQVERNKVDAKKRKVENASHNEEAKVFVQSRLCIITQTETEAIAEPVFLFQSVDAEKAEVVKEL